jgi:hypothetical protein
LNQTRPVLRYHGGKWKLAPWILEHFPPHRVYVEPFGGGGSVLMRKPRSYAEVYNDTWETVVNVFKVLRDPAQAAALEQLLRLTPYARDEYTDTNTEACADIDDPVERARRTILRSLAGFGSASTNGDYATGFRANSHRSGTTPAHDWANYPGHVSAFTARLAGVCIENRPAAEVILQHDRELTPDTVRLNAKHYGGFKLPGSNRWRFPDTIPAGLAPPKEDSCLTSDQIRSTSRSVLEEYDNLLGRRTQRQRRPSSTSGT